MSMNKNNQKGSVSLFVVVFAALLLTIVTVSFVRIMIKDQQQANANDLSQSAYDSAQVGVEDAKRAVLRYQNICDSGGDCNAARIAVDSLGCNVAIRTLSEYSGLPDGSEINVQSDETKSLDQAYTCVKINLETNDYLGSLDKDVNKFIPLVGMNNFKKIKIEWFNTKDMPDGAKLDTPDWNNGAWLLNQNDWKSNRPPIMRTQLIQVGNSFTLDDLNNNLNGSSNNTLFLYPTNIVGESVSFNQRLVNVGPTQATCVNDLSDGGYACSSVITLPSEVSAGDRTTYLNLRPIYNSSHFRIILLDASDGVIKFNAVQPEVDSTGRANNIFRRVQSRIEMTDVNFPYPAAEVDTTSNLCKDFKITDKSSDYKDSCTP